MVTGGVINTKEKVLAWLKEIDAERAVGLTFEQLEARAADTRNATARFGPTSTGTGTLPESPELDLARIVEVLDRHGAPRRYEDLAGTRSRREEPTRTAAETDGDDDESTGPGSTGPNPRAGVPPNRRRDQELRRGLVYPALPAGEYRIAGVDAMVVVEGGAVTEAAYGIPAFGIPAAD